MAPSNSWLVHQIFNLTTRVRIPLTLLIWAYSRVVMAQSAKLMIHRFEPCYAFYLFRDVIQLVECVIWDDVVAGSSPVISTKLGCITSL